MTRVPASFRAFAAAAVVACVAPAAADDAPSRWIDPSDGAFDLSEHLLTHRGFLPVPILITEPALGYGGGLAAVWFAESVEQAFTQSQAEYGRKSPPTMAALGAFGTQNGSMGGVAGYLIPMQGDRYRYAGGIAKVSLDLDWYGPRGRAWSYTLDAAGLLQQFLARVGSSDWFIGARYAFVTTETSSDRPRPLEIPAPQLDVRIGRASLIVDYDSRDNFLTPRRGTYMEAEFATAGTALGGTVDFNSVYARVFHYLPLAKRWLLGLRGDVRATSDSTPFFAKPYVDLRGVPALRYQDDRTVVGEMELRWDVTARWAAVAFAGAGKAYGQHNAWSDAETALTRGVGFRYLIARKLGMMAGIDVARGPNDETAIYFQVGSAWR